MQQYRYSQHVLLMRYLAASYGSASIKNAIKNSFASAFAKPISDCNHFGNGYLGDGYRAYIFHYQWGSNKIKADYGLTYYKWNIVDPGANYKDVAEDYLHYIHGVNPFNMVYLTNMNGYGASKSTTAIYHDWFSENSAISPAPGYMPGGPNKDYTLDECCPSSCGSPANNSRCNSIEVPKNQPQAKMYKEMNHGWPINSWQITEPSDGYQTSYIALLSKFVAKISATPAKKRIGIQNLKVSQSKNSLRVTATAQSDPGLQASIYRLDGKLLAKKRSNSGSIYIDMQNISSGMYIVQISNGSAKENLIIAK